MLTVIMLMMVMSALSVLLLGVVMAQVKPTMFAAKNARTVFAAETGIDSALSQVRLRARCTRRQRQDLR